MSLNKARILSSENDASVKQSQETNIEIKLAPQRSSSVAYPQIPQPQNVNFTMPPRTEFESMKLQTPQEGFASQYIPQTNRAAQDSQSEVCYAKRGTPLVENVERSFADLGNELDSLEKKNKFLELLVGMYENNPLKVNSYVVCKSTLLMDMIKLLTDCDKVDLVIEDEEPGCCVASVAKLIKIDKILITKDGKSEELKYCYNHVYTEFVKYGISLKLTI